MRTRGGLHPWYAGAMKKLRLTLSRNLDTYPEDKRTKAAKADIDALIVAELETAGFTVIRRSDADDAHAFLEKDEKWQPAHEELARVLGKHGVKLSADDPEPAKGEDKPTKGEGDKGKQPAPLPLGNKS